MIFNNLPCKADLHCACLDDYAVPVNLIVRKFRSSFERTSSLQGFLGGSSISSSSLPTQNHTPACLIAQNQVHRSNLKEERCVRNVISYVFVTILLNKITLRMATINIHPETHREAGSRTLIVLECLMFCLSLAGTQTYCTLNLNFFIFEIEIIT